MEGYTYTINCTEDVRTTVSETVFAPVANENIL